MAGDIEQLPPALDRPIHSLLTEELIKIIGCLDYRELDHVVILDRKVGSSED